MCPCVHVCACMLTATCVAIDCVALSQLPCAAAPPVALAAIPSTSIRTSAPAAAPVAAPIDAPAAAPATALATTPVAAPTLEEKWAHEAGEKRLREELGIPEDSSADLKRLAAIGVPSHLVGEISATEVTFGPRYVPRHPISSASVCVTVDHSCDSNHCKSAQWRLFRRMPAATRRALWTSARHTPT